jgi:hypothetical protein
VAALRAKRKQAVVSAQGKAGEKKKHITRLTDV